MASRAQYMLAADGAPKILRTLPTALAAAARMRDTAATTRGRSRIPER